MTRPYDVAFDRILTRVDPERAHQAGFAAIRAGARVARRAITVPERPVQALGLTFPHPLGLAAGFDKNGTGIDALAALGFGHVEIGTVTGLAQPGNPRPRLFRLPADRAVVNRMGFNNDGAAAVAERLHARTAARRRVAGGGPGPILGINIGKSKLVPDDDQASVQADYDTSTRLLAPLADYLVVNVSSPNTPGLRNLQAVERLQPLLEAVRASADAASPDRRVPLLVKIAPDLADEDVTAVADLAVAIDLDGIIATNTTIARDALVTPPDVVDRIGAGGLSGQPLRRRSTQVLRLLRRRADERMTLIGVGGIGTPEDARDRLAAGATLIQAYSGFIYGGPLWARRIVKGLL